MSTGQNMSRAFSPDLCGGAVHLPEDPGYDSSRLAWNAAVDLRPAAVACPGSTDEVSAVVKAAAAAGLQVNALGTGHNAAPLGDLSEVVLLRTSAMTGVEVDDAARTVRVRAGAIWLDAVEAAAEHGLSVLHGSSPDVAVVGYSLGGGLGWYARSLGLQTNSVVSATVVTADGSVVRAAADENADLFWALRGGGGNFGIVTELEFRAFDFTTAYAGMLAWDWQDAERVLTAWAAWAENAPDAVTTAFRILQLPPVPEIPEPFRGRNWVVIDGAVLAGDAAAEAILAPLRALQPQLDTFAQVPTSSLIRLHMDPEGPAPFVSDTAMLDGLPAHAIEAFLRAAGPDSGSALMITELRQLGGALSRRADDAGALASLAGQFIVFAATIAVTAETGRQGAYDAFCLVRELAPWSSGSEYLNFAQRSIDTSAAYDSAAWLRLRSVRETWDPDGFFLANHVIPPLA
jgi:FAD/FMN-containing dehydrogenase